MDDKRPAATNAEVAASFVVPTVSVNRFLITAHDHGIRLAFAEQAFDDVPAQFRTSVFLSLADADELAIVMKQLLEPYAEKIAAFKAVADGSEP